MRICDSAVGRMIGSLMEEYDDDDEACLRTLYV